MIPNDKLLEIVDRRTTMPDALKKADEVLQQAVQGITDLINVPAVINLDFADVQTVMKDKGIAHIGIGEGKGDDKASEAVKMAVESPLLETTISGATHVIINVSGDITLADASDAASYVGSAQAAPTLKKPVSGITNPGDIRSSVVNKPLNIPDFLQKK